MGESLTQRRRVGDEGLRVVKPCQGERKGGGKSISLTVPLKEALANSVPAAAVYGECKRCSELLGVKRV